MTLILGTFFYFKKWSEKIWGYDDVTKCPEHFNQEEKWILRPCFPGHLPFDVFHEVLDALAPVIAVLRIERDTRQRLQVEFGPVVDHEAPFPRGPACRYVIGPFGKIPRFLGPGSDLLDGPDVQLALEGVAGTRIAWREGEKIAWEKSFLG